MSKFNRVGPAAQLARVSGRSGNHDRSSRQPPRTSYRISDPHICQYHPYVRAPASPERSRLVLRVNSQNTTRFATVDEFINGTDCMYASFPSSLWCGDATIFGRLEICATTPESMGLHPIAPCRSFLSRLAAVVCLLTISWEPTKGIMLQLGLSTPPPHPSSVPSPIINIQYSTFIFIGHRMQSRPPLVRRVLSFGA